jgi:hypothetical protein
MSKHNILFIGLDTHKEFVEVAYTVDQRGAKPIQKSSAAQNESINFFMPDSL